MTMNDWGLNPSTVQVFISSVVGLLTLALIVFVYRDAEAGRKTAKAAQESAGVLVKEAVLRTRPWLGISGFEFTPSKEGDDSTEDEFTVHYQNVGALPAQDAVLSLKIMPNMGDSSESYTFEDQVVGTVFPQEPGSNSLSSAMLKEWRTADEDIAIEGLFKYRYGDRDYTTKFKLTIECYEDGSIHELGWWNTETT